jgi:hypothetical protein
VLLQVTQGLAAVSAIRIDFEPGHGSGWQAALGDRVSIRAAGRGRPWISLSDGHSLVTSYVGDEGALRLLSENQARGLSLASGDLDADGCADLVCGYAAPDGSGLLTLHQGNADFSEPYRPEAGRRKSREQLTDAPFLAPAHVFTLPVPPDYLGTGDFDADGHQDVVAAARGEAGLFLLRGNGRLQLTIERVELDGTVTALAVGEINRADGLADVVVGVEGSDGPEVLVFEGPNGSLRREPEVIALPSQATALAIGQLDDSYEYDLAAAAGGELLIVYGRDRRLLEVRETAGLGDGLTEADLEPQPATIDRVPFPSGISAIAIGEFVWEEVDIADLAVRSEDGRVEYLRRREDTWQVVNGVRVGEDAPREVSTAGRVLARAKVSSLATDDLIALDGMSSQVRIVSGGPGSNQALQQITALDADGPIAAVLPMRLSGSALADLVLLTAQPAQISLALIRPMATFSVTNLNDSGAGSLRQAVLEANSSPGADMITFNIGRGVQTISLQSPLPTITDPVMIDGSTQPGSPGTPLIELDGRNAASGSAANGLDITAGATVVKGLAIGNFNGHAISLQQRGNNMIMNNYLGTDSTCTQNRGNGGEGLNIQGSNDNTATSNTIVFNGDGGSVINSSGNLIKDSNLGTDATMTRNKGNRGAGFGFASASNNRFESNRVAFNELGFIGFGGAGNMFGGSDPSLGNIIVRNRIGVLLNNSSNNVFKTNFIGTNPRGNDLGNQGAGIQLEGNSSNNQIGGGVSSFGNTIAFNQTGISSVPGANGNLYLLNSIFGNTATGINNNGGANRGINPPQLISATASASDTLITGRFFGFPNRQFALQFHLNPNASPQQGKIPIGGVTVTTNLAGAVDFTARAPFVLPGLQLTALATDVTTNDTSQFSEAVGVASTARPDLEVKKTGPETAKCREMITWTIEVRNVGTAAAVGFNVEEILPSCIDDEVEVTTSPEGLISFPKVGGTLVTRVPRLDPGAPPVTITIQATLKEECDQTISNVAEAHADGDTNITNDLKTASTRVDCTKITGFSVQRKNVIVSGLGFVKGDQVDINGQLLRTKFRDSDELLVKKGAKSLLGCDPANPGRTNIIRLIRTRDPGAPIIDTEAFATCP